MKQAVFLLAIAAASLFITACQGGGGSAGKGGSATPGVDVPNVPNNEDICNRKGVCLTEADISILRRNSQPRLHVDGENLIRLQAVALGDAYEKQFSSSLSEEDVSFISNLFTKVFGKD